MSAEQFDFKFSIVNERQRKPSNLRPINLEQLLEWIDKQKIEENLKIALKKSASAYPHSALGIWKKNYTKHVSKALALLAKIPEKKEKHEKDDSQETKENDKFDNFDRFPDEFA